VLDEPGIISCYGDMGFVLNPGNKVEGYKLNDGMFVGHGQREGWEELAGEEGSMRGNESE
jgi:hypothetical protein